MQIAAAITAAHQARIIHRDLKPANLLVQQLQSKPSDSQSFSLQEEEPEWLIKVTDFGVMMFAEDAHWRGAVFR